MPPLPVVVPKPPRPRPSPLRWSDVGPGDAWARTAINFVGRDHDWMRDFAANGDGSYPFRPRMLETRKYFARAVVKAFAPDAGIDSSITFADLDPTQSFYKWANIAVQRGGCVRSATDASCPTSRSRWSPSTASIVLALGMRSTANRSTTSEPGTASRSPPPEPRDDEPRQSPRPPLPECGSRSRRDTAVADAAGPGRLLDLQGQDERPGQRPVDPRAIRRRRPAEHGPHPQGHRRVGSEVRGLSLRLGR